MIIILFEFFFFLILLVLIEGWNSWFAGTTSRGEIWSDGSGDSSTFGGKSSHWYQKASSTHWWIHTNAWWREWNLLYPPRKATRLIFTHILSIFLQLLVLVLLVLWFWVSVTREVKLQWKKLEWRTRFNLAQRRKSWNINAWIFVYHMIWVNMKLTNFFFTSCVISEYSENLQFHILHLGIYVSISRYHIDDNI